MIQKLVLMVLFAGIIAVLSVGVACGSDSDDEPVTVRVDIASGDDDGIVLVETEEVANNQFIGMLTGGGDFPEQQTYVSVGSVLYSSEQIRTRGLYRFNISDWSEGDVTFATRCMTISGDPGELTVYIMDDFGELPTLTYPEGVEDVENLWSEGEQVGSALSPEEGEWFQVTIPEETVSQYKSEEGYIALKLKATGETELASGPISPNAYLLLCHEYSNYNHCEKPYVEWIA